MSRIWLLALSIATISSRLLYLLLMLSLFLGSCCVIRLGVVFALSLGSGAVYGLVRINLRVFIVFISFGIFVRKIVLRRMTIWYGSFSAILAISRSPTVRKPRHLLYAAANSSTFCLPSCTNQSKQLVSPPTSLLSQAFPQQFYQDHPDADTSLQFIHSFSYLLHVALAIISHTASSE